MDDRAPEFAIRADRDDDSLVAVVPQPPLVERGGYVVSHLVLVPIAIALVAWLCQHGGGDIAIARAFVDAASHQFMGAHSALLDVVGHQAARGVPFLVGASAFAGGACGFAVPRLRPWTPILLAVGAAMLFGPLLVNVMRSWTTQHCPVDVQQFGGVVDYVADRDGPFWATSAASAGRCLPSGHAGGGYALLSLYFAGWAAGRPQWRWRGLAIGIAAGALFSAVRIAQGAGFASATLWSAMVDWTVCAVLFLPLVCTTKTPQA
jgi:membrane-associated PAP2 superfamily phosphatase|nr:phosphatase PAP2 family protein [Caldimonas sp.]